MIQAPEITDKLFLIKFYCEAHRDFVTRNIISINGKVISTDSYAAFAEEFKKEEVKKEVYGIVYYLQREGEEITGIEGLVSQEDVVAHLRQMIGNTPLLVTYFPKPSDDIERLEALLVEKGADHVLSHYRFDSTNLYMALDRTMANASKRV
ncbi:hypothetical protein J4434_07285 [Candidatus Woesearchaeota archaeon]|nr:hypothetical protein [Candidatus Woesearchaeota archaeon]